MRRQGLAPLGLRFISIVKIKVGGFLIGDFDQHPKQCCRKGFSLSVSHQGKRASTAKAFVQQEIERAQVWQLEPIDVPLANSGEMLLHAVGRYFTNENWIDRVLQSNQSNVRRITFVARARVCKLC
jgi:hypothetical protein